MKEFRRLTLTPSAHLAPRVVAGPGGAAVKLYFGIHKHMHQPYYNTTDPDYWGCAGLLKQRPRWATRAWTLPPLAFTTPCYP